jgi:predicted TIM-barrel fold metal-dependent hydrolase
MPKSRFLAPIDRRTFLGGAASTLGASALSACCADLPPTPVSEIDRTQPIVDAHAHVFNAKDLPGFEFIRDAYIERYAGPFLNPLLPLLRNYAESIEREAPGFREELAALPTAQRSAPPTALLARTLDDLQAGRLPNAGPPELQQRVFSQLEQLAPPPPSAPPQGGPVAATVAAPPTTQRLANFLLQPAFGPSRAAVPSPTGVAAAAAPPAEPSRGPLAPFQRQIRQIFAWFSSFREYRRERIEAWAEFIGTTGPRFVMPAIVDFGYSLDNVNYTEVPVPQQVQLMGILSRRQQAGLLVHGYVPFNPIRFVMDQAAATGTVIDAVENQGFIGVKLYPPMGFQASGNDKISMHFFRHLSEDFRTLGAKIDRALDWLYDYCLEHDVTIMVHTAPSNTPHGNPHDGVGRGRDDWSRRPDPQYWNAVLSANRRNLRVLFGHFGGAYDVTKNRAWVDSIVDLMMNYPNVYGDFSDYDLVLDDDRKQRCRRLELKNYLLALDNGRQPGKPSKRETLRQRLVFGSDWEMLDLIVGIESYTRNMLGFLTECLGGRTEDYAACNALRMIGLDNQNGKAAQRLLKFHPPRSANRETLMKFMGLVSQPRVASRT